MTNPPPTTLEISLWKERKHYPYALGELLPVSRAGDTRKVWFRELTAQEAMQAQRAARAFVDADKQDLREDNDFMSNIKAAHALALALRTEPKAPNDKGEVSSPMWLPEYLLKNLSSDEIGILVNTYNQCVAQETNFKLTLSEAEIDSLQEILANTADTDMPNILLARFSKDALAELAIRFAMRASANAKPLELAPPAVSSAESE